MPQEDLRPLAKGLSRYGETPAVGLGKGWQEASKMAGKNGPLHSAPNDFHGRQSIE
jgi:hypothetical protein